MPKLKTHKGAAKRIKKTGAGKLVRKKAMTSHNRSKESTNQSHRRSRGKEHRVPKENPRVEELIPYK